MPVPEARCWHFNDVDMGQPIKLEALAAGLPVAWVVPREDTTDLDLALGHPGRISAECVGEDAPCEVGVDLFVEWYLRPEESQLCFEFADVELITDAEFVERAARIDRGEPPI